MARLARVGLDRTPPRTRSTGRGFRAAMRRFFGVRKDPDVMEDNPMEKRRQAIETRSNELFKVVVSDVIGLRSGQASAEAAMTRLKDEYRQEMRGFRLVIYRKTRDGRPAGALYWGHIELDRNTNRYVVRHITGGLKQSDIYRYSEASRKERLLDYDRRRLLLNVAHQQCTQVLNSAKKRWRSRANRRGWECQDPRLPPPSLPPGVLPQDEGLLGDLWMFIQRFASTSVDLGILAASYDVDPIHKALNLVFASDEQHPHGRARWLHKGEPLPCLGAAGEPDRLTDKGLREMRWLYLSAKDRKLLLGVEKVRRRLMVDLEKYSGPMNDFRRRSTSAVANASQNVAAAEGRVRDVA